MIHGLPADHFFSASLPLYSAFINPTPMTPFRLFCALLVLGFATLSPSKASAQERGEYIIVSGGPSLRKWEDLRAPGTQHDRWWGNFVRPARVRIEGIQKQDPNAMITWLVYAPAYARRSSEDNRSLTELVESVRDKFRVRLVWFTTGADVINYINNGQNRSRTKIVSFEYFGHSNKYCFMFDYSNFIYGASKGWLHQNELGKIRRGAFSKNAFCKSWGCHTGESMSTVWRKATGITMIGANGKTDYTDPMNVTLSWGGHWTNG